jgi:hypothetical protein
MKLKFKLTRQTTASELAHLGQFITGLAFDRGAHLTVPADCEPAAQIEEPGDDPTPGDTVHVPAGTEAPKRRRRTKAEIEAEKLAEERAQVAYDQARNHPDPEPAGEVHPEPAPLPELPAPTPAAPVTEPAEAAAPAPAAASPSEPAAKDYTEAEVQDLAGKVARSAGPEVVKEKIAALGASRIAELTQEQRNALGDFLTGKLS